MLKREENDLLTRVGPGTKMGSFMRRNWIPFARSEDIAQSERPVRIKLLGENLVAFRDGANRVGVIGELCPHRRASFAYGRCESDGVRCMYHGWQFDINGNCIDIPTEPGDRQMKDRIKQSSYPVKERNGVLWVYMGDAADSIELPELEFNLVPPESAYLSMRVQLCNWLQAMEGSLDSAHAPLLHGRIDQHTHNSYFNLDNRPQFEAQDTPYGVMIGAKRQGPTPRTVHWRVNQFVLPFYTLVPPMKPDPVINGQAWIPMDDENTLIFMFAYHPSDRIPEASLSLYRGGRRDGTESGFMTSRATAPYKSGYPYPDFWPAYTRENDYGYNAEMQRSRYFSGIPGIWPQDAAAQESMGPIVDREQEHLGSTDVGIIRVRRRLLAELRASDTRQEPPVAPHLYRVRPVGLLTSAIDESMADVATPLASRFAQDYGYDPF